MKDERVFGKGIKKEIKKRDKNKCFLCNSKKELTIAHIFVWKQDGGLGCECNGLTICRQCHDKMDFGIGVTKEEQIKLLKLCKMYLTFYYNKEITNEEVTSKKFVLERKG